MWLDGGLTGRQAPVDEAYDANKLLSSAERQNHKADPTGVRHTCTKERHLVECFFTKLKSFRKAAARYDKFAITFKAVVTLTACFIWLQ